MNSFQSSASRPWRTIGGPKLESYSLLGISLIYGIPTLPTGVWRLQIARYLTQPRAKEIDILPSCSVLFVVIFSFFLCFLRPSGCEEIHTYLVIGRFGLLGLGLHLHQFSQDYLLHHDSAGAEFVSPAALSTHDERPYNHSNGPSPDDLHIFPPTLPSSSPFPPSTPILTFFIIILLFHHFAYYSYLNSRSALNAQTRPL